MSEYANYVEQSAYEDGLAKGRDESKKRIAELPNHECEYRKDGVCPVCYRIEELEAQVSWTEITEDPTTHPPSGKPVMVIGGLPYFMSIIEHVPSISTFEPEKINGWIGKQWRLLCDLDYPVLGDKV